MPYFLFILILGSIISRLTGVCFDMAEKDRTQKNSPFVLCLNVTIVKQLEIKLCIIFALTLNMNYKSKSW